MDETKAKVVFPAYGLILTRGSRYVAFNPQTFVAAEINSSAKLFLEILREPAEISKMVEEFKILTGMPNENAVKIQELLEKWEEDRLLEQYPLKSEGLEWQFNPQLAANPQAIYISLTSACNQSCVYCFNSASRSVQAEQGIGELNVSQWKKVFEEAKEIGFGQINFTGGEPLLSPNFKEVAAEAKSLGLQVKLLTNGTLIDEAWASWIIDNIDIVNISLDSSRPEEHDRVRGEGTFEKAISGIKQLIKMGHPSVIARPVVTRYNVYHLSELIDFIHYDLGCKIGPPTICVPNSLDELVGEESLLPELREYFDSIIRFTDKATSLVGHTPWEHPDLKYACRCGTGSVTLSIDPQGDIYPCQALHTPDMLSGNVLENSLGEIYNNSAVLKHIRTFPLDEIEECRDCSLVTVCGTGCRAIAHNLYGNLSAFNPLFCPLYKEASYERIWRWIDSQAQFSVVSI